MAGVTITGGIATATPVVLAQTIPGEDALCQTPLAAPVAADGQDRRLPARRERPRRQGLQRRSGRRGRDDPLQPDQRRTSRRTTTGCRRSTSTARTPRSSRSSRPHRTSRRRGRTGIAAADAGRRDGGFSSRGPVGDFIKPDITAPGIQVLAGMTPQPTATAERPAWAALPGDRRHVDVVPALGRRLGARPGGASRLVAGRDQVGAHDVCIAERRQGGRRRRRLDPFDAGAGWPA